MKPEELRIGNWVDIKCIDKNAPDYFQFETFKKIEIDIFILMDIVNESNHYLYAPIPITEQWLLDFGFTRHHADYYNHVIILKNVVDDNGNLLGSYSILIFPDDTSSASTIYGSLEIKYIHQLQNLYYALTGKELIKNK